MTLTIYSIKLEQLQAVFGAKDAKLAQNILNASQEKAAAVNNLIIESEGNAPSFKEALEEIVAGEISNQSEDSAPVYLYAVEAICKFSGEQLNATNLANLPAELLSDFDDLLQLQGVPQSAGLASLTTVAKLPLPVPAALDTPNVNFLTAQEVQTVADTLETVYDDEYDGQIVITFNDYYEIFSVAAEQQKGLIFFSY